MDHSTDYLEFDDRLQWRAWLQEHPTETEVWLILFKKKARGRGLALEDAIEEALCFGWIDGALQPIAKNRFALRFSPRTRNSIWSVNNIRRVEKLIAEEKMTEAGLSKVAEAKENGQWVAAIQREQIDVIPEDLARALRKTKGGLATYRALKDSRKKMFIYSLQNAKLKVTREKRIHSIVDEVLRK